MLLLLLFILGGEKLFKENAKGRESFGKERERKRIVAEVSNFTILN